MLRTWSSLTLARLQRHMPWPFVSPTARKWGFTFFCTRLVHRYRALELSHYLHSGFATYWTIVRLGSQPALYTIINASVLHSPVAFVGKETISILSHEQITQHRYGCPWSVS
jgi:hypothetical protein